jgi:hypothetical protein
VKRFWTQGWLALISLLVAAGLDAQSPTSSAPIHFLSPALSWGQIAPHRPEMAGLLGPRCLTGSLSIGRPVTASWAHQGRRRGAIERFELSWTATGSPSLGNQATWLQCLEWPWRARFHSEVGLGLGWTNTPYDPVFKPTALALGSTFNAAIRLGLGRSFPLTDGIDLILGLRLTHLSNGGITQPNLGTNRLDFHTSIRPKTSTSQPPISPDVLDPPQYFVAFSAGPRDLGLPGGTRAALGTLRAFRLSRERAHHVWRPVAGLGLTVAYAHNGRPIQFHPEFGATWPFGKLTVRSTLGWVLNAVQSSQGPVFLHVDLEARMTPKWFALLGLRSYRLKAEFPSLGIRYALGS